MFSKKGQHRCRRNAEQFHEHFKQCGFRMTMPREIIMEFLHANLEKHPSTEEIYMEVHKKYPSIGLTTVYRTLDILVNMGLVYKFDFGDGRARYELSQQNPGMSHHHHLICTNCKTVINYTDFIDDEVELLKKTEKGLSKKYNFQINDHIIQFHGLCKNCQTQGG